MKQSECQWEHNHYLQCPPTHSTVRIKRKTAWHVMSYPVRSTLTWYLILLFLKMCNFLYLLLVVLISCDFQEFEWVVKIVEDIWPKIIRLVFGCYGLNSRLTYCMKSAKLWNKLRLIIIPYLSLVKENTSLKIWYMMS